MKRRGRTIAAWTAAAAIAAAGAAGIAGRDRLVETWQLWKLDSAALIERFRAAKVLGAMRSAKAVPGVLALLKDHSTETVAAATVWGPDANAGNSLARVLASIGAPAVPALAQVLEESRGQRQYWRRCACRALADTRLPAALPTLIRAFDDPDLCVRLFAFESLERFGPEARKAVPAISAHLDDTNRYVRQAAARALEKISGKRPGRT